MRKPDDPDRSRSFTDVTLNTIDPSGTPSTFNGKLYLDTAGTIPAGSITNGVISIKLPSLTQNQCYPMTNVEEGLSYSPNTGLCRNVWIYVKNNDPIDTTTYRLTGSFNSTSCIKFVYSSIPSTYTGTFTDTYVYTYECNLVAGWNICVWSWDGNNRRCTKTTTEADFGTVTSWSLSTN